MDIDFSQINNSQLLDNAITELIDNNIVIKREKVFYDIISNELLEDINQNTIIKFLDYYKYCEIMNENLFKTYIYGILEIINPKTSFKLLIIVFFIFRNFISEYEKTQYINKKTCELIDEENENYEIIKLYPLNVEVEFNGYNVNKIFDEAIVGFHLYYGNPINPKGPIKYSPPLTHVIKVNKEESSRFVRYLVSKRCEISCIDYYHTFILTTKNSILILKTLLELTPKINNMELEKQYNFKRLYDVLNLGRFYKPIFYSKNNGFLEDINSHIEEFYNGKLDILNEKINMFNTLFN